MDDVIAALGIVVDGDLDAHLGGDKDEKVYLWPENVRSWNCWVGLQTQWCVGVGGPTGLDYAGVRAYLDELDLGPARREVFAGIQACERATLEVWAEQRERDS